jgi:hypothetical protein
MYYSIQTGILGSNDIYFIRAARESQESWINNIFHNAHFGIFRFGGGKLELIAQHHEMPKFRKCKCDSLETAELKIHNWLNKDK